MKKSAALHNALVYLVEVDDLLEDKELMQAMDVIYERYFEALDYERRMEELIEKLDELEELVKSL